MKNLVKPTFLVVLMSLSLATASNAFSISPRRTANMETASPEESQRLINRLDEIKAMDVSTMTRKQKRELKHEVKAIQHQQQTNGGGVYISVGAAIIIILLLIILL
jgi:TolA-binding protein